MRGVEKIVTAWVVGGKAKIHMGKDQQWVCHKKFGPGVQF